MFDFQEQREDELMLRQNSTEHAFESDNNDSKSDAAVELNFDSDAASEHVSVIYFSNICYVSKLSGSLVRHITPYSCCRVYLLM